jgi:hypothetical protein
LRKPVKEKPHAADFLIVVNDAVKLAVELPGDDVRRPWGRERIRAFLDAKDQNSIFFIQIMTLRRFF